MKDLGIIIYHTRYIKSILNRFKREDAKENLVPIAANMNFKKFIFPEDNDNPNQCPYRELIVILLYLITCTRPDASFSVSDLARFVLNPIESHCKARKDPSRYIKLNETHDCFIH